MSHSHDTSTPAMSAETVPSEDCGWRYEIVYGPEGEAAYAWVFDEAGVMVGSMKTHYAIRIVSTLSASHLAKEGGEAGAVRLARIEAQMLQHGGVDSDDMEWMARMVRASLGAPTADAAWAALQSAALPQPSPALAKGGDAYYAAISQCLERYMSMASRHGMHKLLDFIVEAEDAVDGKAPINKLNRWLGYIQGTLVASKVTTVEAERDWTRPLFRPLDFPDTPTEGPASQTEGMGGTLPDVRLDSEKAEEWPAAQKALWRVVTGEDLNDGHYINAYRLTEKLYAAIAALTPPETAEAVPVAWAYEKNGKTFINEHHQPWKADSGWKITRLGPDPEAARLREDLERVTRERGVLAEAIGEAVIKTGICRADAGGLTGPQLLLLLDGLVETYESSKRERDDAVRALETAREALKDWDGCPDHAFPSTVVEKAAGLAEAVRAALAARSASSQGGE